MPKDVAKSRHTSRAYNDLGYEDRVQAAIEGIASGKYKNASKASAAEDVSLEQI